VAVAKLMPPGVRGLAASRGRWPRGVPVPVPGLRVGISSVGVRGHALLGLASLNMQPLWSAILTAAS